MRLALAQEDAKDLSSEETVPVHEEVTPGVFIASGLELEAHQYVYLSYFHWSALIYIYYYRIRLKADAKALDSSATALQLSKIEERKNALRQKLKAWTDIQRVYMPAVSVSRAHDEQATADKPKEIPPWKIPLYLPSSLARRFRTDPKLIAYEFRLRTAQCFEALDELRRHLRLRSHMMNHKDRQVTGQRDSTRSRTLLSRTQVKVNASAAKYNRAHVALYAISHISDDVGVPDARLRELHTEDIRGFFDDTDKKVKAQKTKKEKLGLGQGQKTTSWIWKVVGTVHDTGDEALQECAYFSLILYSAHIFI